MGDVLCGQNEVCKPSNDGNQAYCYCTEGFHRSAPPSTHCVPTASRAPVTKKFTTEKVHFAGKPVTNVSLVKSMSTTNIGSSRAGNSPQLLKTAAGQNVTAASTLKHKPEAMPTRIMPKGTQRTKMLVKTPTTTMPAKMLVTDIALGTAVEPTSLVPQGISYYIVLYST